MPRGRVARPVADRIRDLVAISENGCWEFQGFRDNRGYGHMCMTGRKTWKAHRVSYTEFVGPIPEGLEIDHLCRVTYCVNPDHLEAVTPEENIRRKVAAHTHCRHGHEYTPENIHWNTAGDRVCRACRLAASRRYEQKKRRVTEGASA